MFPDKTTDLIPEEEFKQNNIGERLVEGLIKNNLDVTPENVSKILVLIGVPLNRENIDEEVISGLDKNIFTEKEIKEYAVEFIYYIAQQASEMLHSFYNEIGYASGNAMWQGLKTIGNLVTFGNVETVSKQMRKADDILQKAAQLKSAVNPSESQFKELFREVTGGVEFNRENVQKLLEMQIKIFQGEMSEESDEFKNAMKDAFGVDCNRLVDTPDSLRHQQNAGTVCDIVLLTQGLKLFRMGNLLSSTSTIGKYVAAFATGAANLGGWTATQEGLNILTRGRTRQEGITSEDMQEYGIDILQSAGYGGAGGLWGELVVGRAMAATDRATTKCIQKVFPESLKKHMASAAEKVAEVFSKTKIVTGADIMGATLRTPEIAAKGVGFLTEVAGFTGYQMIVDIATSMLKQDDTSINSVKNVLIQMEQAEGELNEEKLERIHSMSDAEAIMELLRKEFNIQLENLATIKGVESFIRFTMSGRMTSGGDYERYRKYRSLNEMQIKQNTVDGVTRYDVKTADGREFVAESEYELIAFCNQQMQAELLTGAILDILNKKGINTNTAEDPTLKFVRPERGTPSLAEEPENPAERGQVPGINPLPPRKPSDISLSEVVSRDAMITSTLSRIKFGEYTAENGDAVEGENTVAEEDAVDDEGKVENGDAVEGENTVAEEDTVEDEDKKKKEEKTDEEK